MKHDAEIRATKPETTDYWNEGPDKLDLKKAAINAGIPLEISDILDALPFYVMVVDEEHHILQANRAVQDELGLKPEAVIGKYCPEVIHGVKEPWYACPLEEALKKGQPIEREAIDQKTGRWIRSAVYPIERLTQDGRKVFFHMVSDITDRKEAEQQAENARIALKTYAAHMVNSQEEERKRIGRELHDDTIQNLSLLCRKLENISTSAPLSPPVVEGLHQAREIGEGLLQGLRGHIRDIRPPILDDLGIVASIRRLILDLTERTDIEGKITLSGDERRLSSEVETGVYRIAQEALWNVEHHSKATNVVVTVTFADCQFRLDVKDNGVGIDFPVSLTALSANGHLGLLGMQERAELLGGKLEIQSNPGKGTLVSIIVPIPQGSLENLGCS